MGVAVFYADELVCVRDVLCEVGECSASDVKNRLKQFSILMKSVVAAESEEEEDGVSISSSPITLHPI